MPPKTTSVDEAAAAAAAAAEEMMAAFTDRFIIERRMVPEHGITLPWQWVAPCDDPSAGSHKGDVVDSGTVFVTVETLEAVASQDPWAGAFGESLTIGWHEKLALVQAGLAVEETRGGVHGTERMKEMWARDLVWPADPSNDTSVGVSDISETGDGPGGV